MKTDDDIRSRLLSAGVPEEALSTTLLREGHTELREVISKKLYSSSRLLFFGQAVQPTGGGSICRGAALAFYLAAKEMVLLGESVYCCSLVDLHDALYGQDKDNVAPFVDSADYVAIRDFYDPGGRGEPYFTPYEASHFASWLIKRHSREGKGFLLHSGSPLAGIDRWWTNAMVGYLQAKSRSFILRGK